MLCWSRLDRVVRKERGWGKRASCQDTAKKGSQYSCSTAWQWQWSLPTIYPTVCQELGEMDSKFHDKHLRMRKGNFPMSCVHGLDSLLYCYWYVELLCINGKKKLQKTVAGLRKKNTKQVKQVFNPNSPNMLFIPFYQITLFKNIPK